MQAGADCGEPREPGGVDADQGVFVCMYAYRHMVNVFCLCVRLHVCFVTVLLAIIFIFLFRSCFDCL